MDQPIDVNAVAPDPLPESRLRQLHEHILNSVSDGVHVVDLRGMVMVENAASLRMLGWDNGSLVGTHGHTAIHHHHADGTEHPASECPVLRTIQDGRMRQIDDDVFWRRDGSPLPVAYSASPLRDEQGMIYGAAVVFRDITEQKQAAARLLRMAQYCSLTDLPNRALFADRLETALAAGRRYQTRFALLYVDLDRFKPVNDTYGHAVGDHLLQQVALRMKQSIRQSDTIGRIGGDEFTVLLPVIETDGDALAVAEKIRAALARPFAIDGHLVEISSSIGLALFPEHGNDALSLSQHADQAMYLAKRDGRNAVRMCGAEGER